MNEKDILLADGTMMSVKVNFGTLYYIKKCGLIPLQEKIDKEKAKSKPNQDKIEDLEMEAAKKIIYVIMRSNGRVLDEEQAMLLVPFDTDEIQTLFNEFGEAVEKEAKKKANPMKTPS